MGIQSIRIVVHQKVLGMNLTPWWRILVSQFLKSVWCLVSTLEMVSQENSSVSSQDLSQFLALKKVKLFIQINARNPLNEIFFQNNMAELGAIYTILSKFIPADMIVV